MDHSSIFRGEKVGMKIDKVILLSAGQGSRLLPLTADRPKCLIDLSGRSILGWQIETLASQGVTEIVVVTGFMAHLVECELAKLARPGLTLRTLYNPFYKVADNLGSCWIAIEEMGRNFALLNGDTIISGEIAQRLLSAAEWPITVVVDVKPKYDCDDMKVSRDGERLLRIDKTLSADQTNAESIGFLAFRGEGISLFSESIESWMRTPAGVQNWYLKAIDSLAPNGKVGTICIEGLEWSEIDYLTDIEEALLFTDRWNRQAFRFATTPPISAVPNHSA